MTSSNDFQMVAKTFQGLEDVLCDELIALGAKNVEPGLRMVSFDGDLEMMYKANLCCRTALRILKPIVKFTAESPDDLYDYVRDLDWEQFMDVDSTFMIDATVNSAEFTHSKYVTYRVKDAIADHFYDKYKRRPSIRLSNADLRINVHISDDHVTLSLDSSGEPLNQRGYRQDTVKAPINEVLAAGIILKSGWRGNSDFADPMCGSGTFLIEAALIAANINPGIYRKDFAFEKWRDFDPDLFERLYNDDSSERKFSHKIYGGDIDPDAYKIALRNIRSAGAAVEKMIEMRCGDFIEWDAPSGEGVLISNPPYGERLRPENIATLYKEIGNTLKRKFSGWHAWLISSKDDNFSEIGLKPSLKYPILNGSLECEVREFVLFDGAYNQFRSTGGSIKEDTEIRKETPKTRRLSEKEWKSEARKFNRREDNRRRDDRRDDRRGDDKRSYRRDDRRRDDRRDDRRGDDKRNYKRDGHRGNDIRNDRRRDYKNDDTRRDKRYEQPHAKSSVRAPREVKNKEPRLPADSATIFSLLPLRSRRKKSDATDPEAE